MWYTVIGLLAAVCIAAYMVPQLIKTIRTKDTCSISIIMFSIAIIGDLFFVINGLGVMGDKGWAAGLPIFLGNLFALIISAIVAFYKIRNMIWSKKFNIREKDIPDHFNEIKEKIRLQKQAEKFKEENNVEVPPAEQQGQE